MNKKVSATITDVARQANVTTITVSRAFNKPHLVKPDTLERILAAARDLDYVPNAFARGLKRSESLIVGVVTASVDNPFYSEMIKAISREAKAQGYTIMLIDTDGLADVEEKAIETLLGYRVAGIILSPVSDEPGYQPAYLSRLKNGDIPVVQLDRALAGTPFSQVVLDNYHSGLKGALYLLSKVPDLQRVLVLTGPAGSRISHERLEGVKAAVAGCGRTVTLDVLAGDYTLQPAYDATLAYLRQHSAPGALFGFNQLITLGALKALRECGIHRSDLAICGIDRLPFADIFEFPVPCVAHDGTQAGALAMRLLLEQIRDPLKGQAREVVTGALVNG
ncbi:MULTISPECIES: LacI family DNA-binding transcriptional regulator [Pseudomonas]|uniref:LacI family transcriptional regulator n=1 Tax=Pseudomonas quercus TaxID=2722792 RepID=A0ABX0Y9Z1_9PSED|nr:MULTISPECIES: LacI family DNA-binding transcriptional regulator [Pseudomonas]MBF7141626.1 LacI family DNA-binding transcriptional regulator [Pseudomonas sp. LY10J]NJP00165.1 LacI family transcriptional regulator [Pseudomonas quercus]